MDSRILTVHNGTFQISIPTEFVSNLGWISGHKLVLELTADHNSLIITAPQVLLRKGNLHGLKALPAVIR